MFHSIVHSTIWREPNHVRIAWVTLLALADRDGIAWCSIPGLADAARITQEQAEEAVAKFQAPDPGSSDLTDGKRIEVVRGGIRLLNHGFYQYLMSPDERREKDAERKRRKRALLKQQATADTADSPRTSDFVRDVSHQTRPDNTKEPPVVPLSGGTTPTEPKRPKRRTIIPPDWKPTANHVELARSSNLDLGREALKFKTHAEATGRLMANWTAAFTTWLLKASESGSQGPANGQRNGYQKPPGLVQHEANRKRPARLPWVSQPPGMVRE